MNLPTQTKSTTIHILDLKFLGLPGAIAAYSIPHSRGAILIESGPGSTVPALIAGLDAHRFQPGDISDVFVTHIHLDHAGASGWMARQGARIHVHPVGAPHLANPEKLLASARRIYGDSMDPLWGEFLPVPEQQIEIIEDHQVVEVDGLKLQAFSTPGHASHHHAYLFEDTCFCGDIGGIRLQGSQHLRVPMPPPEFNLEQWIGSVNLLKTLKFSYLAPTHFGLFSDPQRHLESLSAQLVDIGAWMDGFLPTDPPIDEINQQFLEWTRRRTLAEGVSPTLADIYEAANPSWMSAAGMQRYWRAYGHIRQP